MLYSVSFCITLAFLICQDAFAGTLPAYITLCNRDSPEISQCFKENLQSVGPHLTDGISEFQIPPTSKISVPVIHLSYKNSPIINVNSTLKNVKLDGLEKYDVVDAKINLDDPLLSVQLHFQELQLSCINVVRGKVLSWIVDGEGSVISKQRDVSVTCEWQGERYTQNGKEHLKFKIGSQRSIIKNVEVDVKGFFNQNPETEVSFNQMFNENIDILRSDIENYMAEIICETISTIQNQVFSVFDIDQLFP